MNSRENVSNQNQSSDKSRLVNQNPNVNRSMKQNGFANEPERNDNGKEVILRLPSVKIDRGFHNVRSRRKTDL